MARAWQTELVAAGELLAEMRQHYVGLLAGPLAEIGRLLLGRNFKDLQGFRNVHCACICGFRNNPPLCSLVDNISVRCSAFVFWLAYQLPSVA